MIPKRQGRPPVDTSRFLPVEIVDRPRKDETASTIDSERTQSAIEIGIAYDLRLMSGE